MTVACSQNIVRVSTTSPNSPVNTRQYTPYIADGAITQPHGLPKWHWLDEKRTEQLQSTTESLSSTENSTSTASGKICEASQQAVQFSG